MVELGKVHSVASLKDEPAAMDQPDMLHLASMYETQSEGELLGLCKPSKELETTEAHNAVEGKVKREDTSESTLAAKKTGRAKRKEKRLKNEPPNITGEDGPCGVHVLDYIEARATEMCSMSKALSCKGGSKLTAQKLPRHMRRRAASHNVKRLPRRCREAAAKEMEKSNASGTSEKKKKSRKQRRNTRDLQSKYAQRQRENKWLETHLWHAKRMKMCKKYGYCLSEHCSDKGVRAAYMSLTHGCLISDISYYGCVQLSGSQAHVIKCLSPLFNSDAGLTIAGKAFLTGAREGRAMLYRAGGYPLGALGPVQFLWQASPPLPTDTPSLSVGRERAVAADSGPTSLWIWSHAAMHQEVLSEVTGCVRMYNESHREESGEGEGEVAPVVTMRDMNSDLIRFRVIGPRSHALLMEALKPVFNTGSDQPRETATASDSMEVDPPALPDAPRWWNGATKNDFEQHCSLLSQVHCSIKSASNPAQFQKGSVLAMTVLDPRLSTPSRKLDMVSQYYPLQKNSSNRANGAKEDDGVRKTEIEEAPLMPSLPVGVAYSPLWNTYIRALVSDSKPETHVINQLRARQLVPSSTLDLGQKAARVPVLLIQQTIGPTPRRTSGRGSFAKEEAVVCGWDVVLPSNWGKEFWVSLIYHGARACGLKELQKCSQELQAQHFPNDFPDTPSAQSHYEEEKAKLVEKYTLAPPDKRRNYGKFLIASPFEYPWRELVSAWSQESRIDHFCVLTQSLKRIKLEDQEPDEGIHQDQDCYYSLEGGTARKRVLEYKEDTSDVCSSVDPLFSSFYVLRSTEALATLTQFVDHLFSHKKQKCKQSDLHHLQYTFKVALREFSIDEYLMKHRSALIGVKVQMHQRGTLSSHDVISIPNVSDFAPLLSPSHPRPHSGPKEELHPKGMTVVEGKSLTIGVSSLSKKRVSEVKENRRLIEKHHKKLKREESEDTSAQSPLDSVLPPATADFKLCPVQPSRETFGYVTSAGYRLTTSLHAGIGFCTFAGFLEALYKSYLAPGVSEPLVLVRGDGTQYWFVRLALA